MATNDTVLLGAIAYDPKVVTIWEGFRAWFAQHDQDEALRIMRASGATVGPVYSAAEAANDAHFNQRGVVVEVEDQTFGQLPMHNILPRLSQTPGVWRRPAPTLGQHSAEILAEYGIAR